MDNNQQGPTFVWGNSWQLTEKNVSSVAPTVFLWYFMSLRGYKHLADMQNDFRTFISTVAVLMSSKDGRILAPELQLSLSLAAGSCSELCNLCKLCTTHKTLRSTHKVVSAGMREKTTRLSSCIRVKEVSDCLLALIRGGMSVGPFLQAECLGFWSSQDCS